ncbi:kinase-like protein [Hymenopellis radicata]|nr:kinase-like protein [Hymenopellis radicata]
MFQTGLCFISPWIDNGNVLDFLGTHPGHDRRGWVWDVSAGLNYLHQLDPCIVHKDIRGANLLVGEDDRCYIADFGISIVIETVMPGTNTRGAGTTHWKPLEVFANAGPLDNRKVDIYSFGCTIVEMFTGKPPYCHLKTEYTLVQELQKKERPVRPDILPRELWDAIVEPTLSPSPESRPSAAQVMDKLRALYPEYIEQYLAARAHEAPLKRILEWKVPE